MSVQFSSHRITPIVLAGLIFLLTLFVVLMGVAINSLGFMKIGPEFPWTMATSFLLLYSIFVSIILLRTTTDVRKFWNQSMVAFMGLAMANALFATAISGLSIGQAGSFKFLYLVVTIGFLVFISIVNLTRKIVEYAEKEEWNQPRLKSKKRR
jgi:hypothetical protein